MNSDTPRCQLYVITPPKLSPDFADKMAKALDAAPVASLQLRLETTDEGEWKRAVEKLLPVAQQRNVAFIINNHVLLAKETGADGAHIGVHDMRVKEARAIMGPDKIIGSTCMDSKHLAMTAAEAGADYVSFGPFFTTRSPFYPKENYAPKYMVSPNILTWWSQVMETPCVAAGGITPQNCRDIIKAGADFICASTSIWDYEGGAARAIADFHAQLQEAEKRAAG
jgi:thiamine-phosphate pyrophosphorylase